MAKKIQHMTFRHIAKDITIVVGLVMVWRGIWDILDIIDITLFGGRHIWVGLLAIVAGLLILYIPDHDLKEIEKL